MAALKRIRAGQEGYTSRPEQPVAAGRLFIASGFSIGAAINNGCKDER